MYVIPLNAFMQSRAPKAYVATVIAGNNIFNALGMVLSAVFAVVFLSLGFTLPQLFWRRRWPVPRFPCISARCCRMR